MASQKVQARGQVTLPADVRRSAGILPGDNVVVTMIGPGELLLKTYKAMTLEEILAEYGSRGVEPVVDREIREAWEAEAGDELISRIQSGVE